MQNMEKTLSIISLCFKFATRTAMEDLYYL